MVVEVDLNFVEFDAKLGFVNFYVDSEQFVAFDEKLVIVN